MQSFDLVRVEALTLFFLNYQFQTTFCPFYNDLQNAFIYPIPILKILQFRRIKSSKELSAVLNKKTQAMAEGNLRNFLTKIVTQIIVLRLKR